ncbi:rhodanese-like domain-containing protein [Planctomycetaceae bacterium SH139]
MLLKYFYDPALAHASYMVGCQRSQQAVIVDPGRDVEQYIEAAAAEGMEIVGVAETHIHADYVSGARELAERVQAKLYVSDEGPAEWKYLYLDTYDAQLVKDGDTFSLGKIKFEVVSTPGHTPESISFLVTDQGGGADQPMGIFTGDFIFVGSIGRPDLLEEAAGLAGTAEPGARQLYHSAERFKQLPDFLQVWPAHGAGSACGKGLGAIPSSTVGYEKQFNPALQFTDEQSFVDYILADQPEAPPYFALMKRVNKEGPKVMGQTGQTEWLSKAELAAASEHGTLIDLSSSTAFAEAHLPTAINIPLVHLATWAGWLVDYSKPVYLVAEPEQLYEAVRVLQKIGVDEVAGAFRGSQVIDDQQLTGGYRSESPRELAARIANEQVSLVDVRAKTEWNEGHIPQARHIFLGRLPQHLAEIPRDRPVAVHCASGVRSAIASSVLQSAGFDVINMSGGFNAWSAASLPVSQTPGAPIAATCSVGAVS